MKTQPFWISLDGVDATGKTTVAQELGKMIPDLRLVPEFSSEPVGRYLAEAVTQKPHLISASRMGQSLAFLSDFFHQYDSEVVPGRARGELVLADRGPLSKLVYQAVILSDVYDPEVIFRVLDRLFDLIEWPDLTILLTCDMETVRRRLAGRGEDCDPHRIAFLSRFEAGFRALLDVRPNVVELYQPADTSVAETAAQAFALISARRAEGP